MRICGKRRFVAILAAALVVGSLSEAYGWSYGSYGSAGSYDYASYGSYGSYGTGGCWGSHGRVGIIGRIRARVAARHASRHCYGSYGYGSAGSYGSYGAYSVSYGSAGSYGGGYGSAGSYGGASYSVPVATDCIGCSASTSTDPTLEAEGSAVINVTVPTEATVFVNNKETTSMGPSRSYVSNSLKPGQTYLYNFRVQFEENGQTVVKNEAIKLSAGDRVAISFAGNNDAQLAVAPARAKTELTLSVPEDAKVYLAGSATSQRGALRTYATHRLNEGQSWDGYTIRVEVERNGKTEVKEETVTIIGGEKYELAFNFDNDMHQLAAK